MGRRHRQEEQEAVDAEDLGVLHLWEAEGRNEAKEGGTSRVVKPRRMWA